MEDLIGEVGSVEKSGERAALASLIWSSGSIPMSDRAKMLVKADGRVMGTIGGGCLEAEILNCSRQVIESGKPHLTRYTMTEKQAGESGLNCGGTVRIYTEVVGERGGVLPYSEVYKARRQRQACVMATVLGGETADNRKMLIYSNGERLGSLGADELDRQVIQQLAEVLENEKANLVQLKTDSKTEVFVEPYLPAPLLYIFGGGHVGGQICALAKNVGFEVVIVDDRPMFANAERHPAADDFVVEEIDRSFEKLEIDEQSYIIAATRGHQHDEVVVEQAIATDAAYIGMLGSERKKMLLWKKIVGRGGSRPRLDQVYAPVGLNIGADTPEEIAVSVVAELIQMRRGVRKKWKTKMAGLVV